MIKVYKKIYLEITNNCNLKCPFCIHNDRLPKFMSMEEFKIILKKIKNHTHYLYFHVLGEPLLHPLINEFINEASSDFFVNITTNGYLIEKIKNNNNIRQLNISLHSFDLKNNLSLEEYLNNIFSVVDSLSNTYISYRLWTNNKETNQIISLLEKKYNIKITNKNIKLKDNVYLNFHDEFIWPDLKNDLNIEKGTCYALKDHIGILVDGTIVPCCLDTKGSIKLGNIFQNSLEEVIESKRYKEMYKGFLDNKKIENLCKKCQFIK